MLTHFQSSAKIRLFLRLSCKQKSPRYAAGSLSHILAAHDK